jgi:twitching motility protein PilJ
MPQLVAILDQVADGLIKQNKEVQQLYGVAQQLAIAHRIDKNLNQFFLGNEAANTSSGIGEDVTLLGRDLEGLVNGDAELKISKINSLQLRDQLNDGLPLYRTINDSVNSILAVVPELLEIKQAARKTEAYSAQLLTACSQLAASIEKQGVWLKNTTLLVAIVAAGVAVFLLLLLGYRMNQNARRRLEATAETNRRNQRAILRLLDEMTNLAEGDLTVHATVTEDITGAIADSVNYSIDALRKLVTTINQTAVQVSSAAQSTQVTAQHLADASVHQADEIATATTAIRDIADSIEQVSKNSSISAKVAQKAVQISHKGTQAVSRTIDGMGTIREQIQETSKRIKRLGESSQEIGDIVSLINEIADQTNILALNAAIQASTAGEAGRGFAVVADEVQRLAERAGNATKQIEALVKAIQTDTNEAVISMEQSTANVVTGAKLSEHAGEALIEIESVSNQLALLIKSISQAARQQSSAAANITNNMNVIQKITMQTSERTTETANSVKHLTGLSAQLRQSVAGFKLPETGENNRLFATDN